jgi:glutathione S-transferase
LLYVDSRFTSPYAMSAFVTLHEKGLPFDVQTLDLAQRENQRADFAALTVTRRVPTLVHGDFSLSESSAISEYLEERHPAPPVYPRELRARARSRQVQAWLRSDLMALRQERSTEVVFYQPVRTALTESAQAAADKLIAAADALLPPGADHLFGAWCIADTDLALMLNRLVINGDAVPERLARYARVQWQRPSIQAWIARTQAKT